MDLRLSATLLSTICGFVSTAVAYDPRTDHKCVWNCSGPTITVTIERQVEHRLAPPTIVWVRPSAEGATGSGFASVNNAAMQRELEDQSVTPWILAMRGKRALGDGDAAKGLAYLEAARSRNPTPSELQDILREMHRAQRMLEDASRGGIDKFQKSPNRTVELSLRDVPASVFDPTRPELEPLRQEILPLLYRRAEATIQWSKLDALRDRADPRELDKAATEVKVAQEAIDTKVKEAKKRYVLE